MLSKIQVTIAILSMITHGTYGQCLGQIFDINTGLGIRGCHIIATNDESTTVSDHFGLFDFQCNTTFKIHHLGYETLEVKSLTHQMIDTFYLIQHSQKLNAIPVSALSAKTIWKYAETGVKNRTRPSRLFYITYEVEHTFGKGTVNTRLNRLKGKTKIEAEILWDHFSNEWWIGDISIQKDITPNMLGITSANAITDYYYEILGDIIQFLSMTKIQDLFVKEQDVLYLTDSVLDGREVHVLEVRNKNALNINNTIHHVYIDQHNFLPLLTYESSSENGFSVVERQSQRLSKGELLPLDTYSKKNFFKPSVSGQESSWEWLTNSHVENSLLFSSNIPSHFKKLRSLDGTFFNTKLKPLGNMNLLDSLVSTLSFENELANWFRQSAFPSEVLAMIKKNALFSRSLDCFSYRLSENGQSSEHAINVYVNRTQNTPIGYTFLVERPQTQSYFWFDGINSFDLRLPSGKTNAYDSRQFGLYKPLSEVGGLYAPLHQFQWFGNELFQRSKLRAKQSLSDTLVNKIPVWAYGLVTPQDTITVYFQKRDSLLIGYRYQDRYMDISKFITDLEKLKPRYFLSKTSTFLQKSKQLKEIKPKNRIKKIVGLNYLGERVKNTNHTTNLDLRSILLNNGIKSINQKSFTLLAFWFSSCYYCIQSMPKLQEMHQDLADKDFQVLGINPVDVDPVAIEDFLQKKGITYPNTMDAEDFLGGYEPAAYPTYILLDKDGQVLQIQEGYEPKALERMVRKHVK